MSFLQVHTTAEGEGGEKERGEGGEKERGENEESESEGKVKNGGEQLREDLEEPEWSHVHLDLPWSPPSSPFLPLHLSPSFSSHLPVRHMSIT